MALFLNKSLFHTTHLYRNSYLIRRKLKASSSASTSQTGALRGWRKHAAQFRSKPGSYIVSFAILHELTAIAPIPLIYVFLSTTDIKIPFPTQVLDDANKFINRVVTYYGIPPFENGSRIALNAATSYAIVKMIMPLRIAACVWITPWAAERIIGPIMGTFKRVISRT